MPKKHKEVLEDSDIIKLYQSRDERAIKETDKKYGRSLFALCYNILKSRAECEECKNDTYLSVWSSIPPAEPRSLEAYLTQLARNHAIDRYRSMNTKKRRMLTPATDELANLDLEHEWEDQMRSDELKELISRFLRTLPDRQRYIFIARYYMERAPREIAQRIRVSNATVYRELDEIKQKLRQFLADREVLI